jgi:Tfp pilus assembly protein PilO
MIKAAEFSIIRVAIFGLVLGVAYFFSIYDSGETILNEMQALKNQIAEEATKKVETEKILKKEEQMRSDVALLAKTYEEVKSKIPIDFESSELRIIIEQVSSATNIKINKLRAIQNPIQPVVQNPENHLVDQVAIEYSFQGDYNQVKNFITQLSQVEKIIKVSDLKITLPVASQNGPLRQLNVDAMILGFKQSPNIKDKKATKDSK